MGLTLGVALQGYGMKEVACCLSDFAHRMAAARPSMALVEKDKGSPEFLMATCACSLSIA